MPKNSPKSADINSMRHTAAHILAAAVKQMFPEAQFGIGPVIEDGFYYDFILPRSISEKDFPEIEKRMRQIIEADLPVEQRFLNSAEALSWARKTNQPFKKEIIEEIQSGARENPESLSVDEDIAKGTRKKGDKISFYKLGDFDDLCRGPHVKSTGQIPKDAFKLTRVAGAYWRGSEKNPQMQRIYGVLFANKKELLAYENLQEEIKKRDHRELGKRLKLFTFDDLVGPGLPLWLPNGTIIREQIERFAKETEKEWGYEHVVTPHIAKKELFETSGHLPYYADSMFPGMKLDDGEYYLKAMNCPATHLIYRSQVRSYRELPIRLAEYGTVYRYELSGTLAGLLRVRMLSMNDAHIYCTREQIGEEFKKVIDLIKYYYKIFGIEDYYFRLSLHDPKNKDKYIDSPEMWEFTENELRRVMKQAKVKFIEAVGEAAFYGPKIDVQLRSVTGREETASTNQLDFAAAQRFNLNFVDKDGKERPVFVIHRAPLSTHERFLAFLIEHYAGAFPVWLSPVQVSVLPIGDKHNKYAQNIAAELAENNVRVEVDERNESVGKKIREAEMQKIPYMLVVGDKEMKAKKVAVRARGEKDLGTMSVKKFVDKITDEIENKIVW